ncbi:Trafficking protein particle complex subunit 33 [Ascosphaera acerosa]|nr:Trafficking protein particle complex subunit 33 [Ascosphaera acerosa]
MSFETPSASTISSAAIDPYSRFLSTASLDLLLIELVPMVQRIIDAQTTGKTRADGDDGGDGPGGTDPGRDGSGSGDASMQKHADDEARRESLFYRLEGIGFRVGQGLAERFSRDRPRFTDHLDVIKFLCKDLWTILFQKQIDNLKTNHRGVYVLTDHTFKPLIRMSTPSQAETVAQAQPYLWFPCGLIRGALAAMGIESTVHAETVDLPGAIFQIKTTPTKL